MLFLYKILSFSFIAFLFKSCFFNTVSDVVEKNGHFYIKPRSALIDNSQIIKWPVGPSKKVVISKGFLFDLYLPQIPNETISKLFHDYQIDSWIVSLKKTSSGSEKPLESFHIPFINETSLAIKGSLSYKANQRKKIILRVYYTAAAMSERFERFTCPVSGHNLILKDIKLLERKSFDQTINVSSKFGTPFNRKVFQYTMSNNKVNGGKSLLGEYWAELALYSSRKKRIFSNFYGLANAIRVGLEMPKPIKGCSNFKIPKRDALDFPLKDALKF